MPKAYKKTPNYVSGKDKRILDYVVEGHFVDMKTSMDLEPGTEYSIVLAPRTLFNDICSALLECKQKCRLNFEISECNVTKKIKKIKVYSGEWHYVAIFLDSVLLDDQSYRREFHSQGKVIFGVVEAIPDIREAAMGNENAISKIIVRHVMNLGEIKKTSNMVNFIVNSFHYELKIPCNSFCHQIDNVLESPVKDEELTK